MQTRRDEVARDTKSGKMRACLGCEEKFYSTGIDNRVCHKCKESSLWRASGTFSTTFYRPQTNRGAP